MNSIWSDFRDPISQKSDVSIGEDGDSVSMPHSPATRTSTEPLDHYAITSKDSSIHRRVFHEERDSSSPYAKQQKDHSTQRGDVSVESEGDSDMEIATTPPPAVNEQMASLREISTTPAATTKETASSPGAATNSSTAPVSPAQVDVLSSDNSSAASPVSRFATGHTFVAQDVSCALVGFDMMPGDSTMSDSSEAGRSPPGREQNGSGGQVASRTTDAVVQVKSTQCNLPLVAHSNMSMQLLHCICIEPTREITVAAPSQKDTERVVDDDKQEERAPSVEEQENSLPGLPERHLSTARGFSVPRLESHTNSISSSSSADEEPAVVHRRRTMYHRLSFAGRMSAGLRFSIGVRIKSKRDRSSSDSSSIASSPSHQSRSDRKKKSAKEEKERVKEKSEKEEESRAKKSEEEEKGRKEVKSEKRKKKGGSKSRRGSQKSKVVVKLVVADEGGGRPRRAAATVAAEKIKAQSTTAPKTQPKKRVVVTKKKK